MHVHVLVKGVVHVKAARPTVLSLSFAQPLQLVVITFAAPNVPAPLHGPATDARPLPVAPLALRIGPICPALNDIATWP